MNVNFNKIILATMFQVLFYVALIEPNYKTVLQLIRRVTLTLDACTLFCN